MVFTSCPDAKCSNLIGLLIWLHVSSLCFPTSTPSPSSLSPLSSHHCPPTTSFPSTPLLSLHSLPPSLQHTYTDLDLPALESCHKTLTVSLGTLAQLITSFCACYEAELRPWSNRQPPRLSGLGQVCKRVHVHMQHVNKVLTQGGVVH